MRLRRFEAATVTEALARVRADLGPEAVILHAREASPSPAHGPAASRVEVTAAVDEEPRVQRWAPHLDARSAIEEPVPGANQKRHPDRHALGRPARAVARPVALEDAEADRMEEIYRMLLELREDAAPAPRMPVAIRPLYRELCRREVPATLARRLLLDLPGEFCGARGRAALHASLGRAFRVQAPAGGERRRRLIALVGPTGVGKTTTIAKLAGQSRQAGDRRVALLSLDTYRIGAMAQMQIYADLLRAPLHAVRTPAELEIALRAEEHADLILLDSTGRGPRHREGIAALRPFLQRVPGLEVHLVLSATTKGSDLEEILTRFSPLQYQHVVVTKLDEALSAGPLLGLALQRDLSISYLTTGQEVPDDLERATPKRLAAFLLPDGPSRQRRGSVGS